MHLDGGWHQAKGHMVWDLQDSRVIDNRRSILDEPEEVAQVTSQDTVSACPWLESYKGFQNHVGGFWLPPKSPPMSLCTNVHQWSK